MKKCLLASTFIFSLNAFASIEGTFNCTGTDKEHPNVIYTGTMVIEKTGQTYSIKSSYSDGVSSIGTGIYNKAKNNFAFVFANPKNAKETGIASMNVDENYNMTSDWAYLNKTVIGHSSCTKRMNDNIQK